MPFEKDKDRDSPDVPISDFHVPILLKSWMSLGVQCHSLAFYNDSLYELLDASEELFNFVI